jgi:Mg2+/Co2+ transporter CorB
MSDLPLWAQLGLLSLLLLFSAFFSISETAMMALNRSRLNHDAKNGVKSAKLTLSMLKRIDRLLATILIGNNLLNTAITTLVTALAIHSFGNNNEVLTIATLAVGALIIVFAEIAPKVVGATYPDRIAQLATYPLLVTQWLVTPLVYVVNGLVNSVLAVFGVRPGKGEDRERISPEELRTLVLESSNYIPAKPRSILLNLLALEDLRVDEVMTPRAQMEVLDLAHGDAAIREQLATCYHNKLPVVDGDISKVRGILHVRRALTASFEGPLTTEVLGALLEAPSFVPSGTAVLMQLQQFQDSGSRQGLVVDEYGEVLGLVTLEDILEEIVGEYTTASPLLSSRMVASEDGSMIVDAATPIRLLNRRLRLGLPEDGATTLNGLILEELQDLPDAEVALRIGSVVLHVLQTDAHGIRTVRIQKL